MLIIGYEESTHLYKAQWIIISMLFSVTFQLITLFKFQIFEKRAFDLAPFRKGEVANTNTNSGGILMYLHTNGIIMHTISSAFTYVGK